MSEIREEQDRQAKKGSFVSCLDRVVLWLTYIICLLLLHDLYVKEEDSRPSSTSITSDTTWKEATQEEKNRRVRFSLQVVSGRKK